MSKPACFTERQWKYWSKSAKWTGINLSWYCRDCLPQYKALMQACGKCAHPETRFGWLRAGPNGEREYVGVPGHINVQIGKAA